MEYSSTNLRAANKQANPLSNLPDCQNFKKKGLNLIITTERVAQLDNETKNWLMDLMKRNMKSQYESTSWGWNTKSKEKEMFEQSAWYLIVRESVSNLPVAFSHFRFDIDFDYEVLYVYEIQVEEDYRGKSIGKFIMETLERLCIQSKMEKIILTVFKQNQGARMFFREVMEFKLDESSPADTSEEHFDYEILSKNTDRTKNNFN
ncbi:N-alpha-acetyltransferase 40 [Lepeophtheirus salmonis]|uniref:N-alpha-acetyltransferase 40 n=1 Tax=Lepeophtheirus salmonis TaxID=72036 RepID=UPI001AEAB9C3|nr:N-alpha-acetyltransferase 40-like [Lepeophtheirus salmonis]